MKLLDDFVREYCAASKISEDQYREFFVPLPCACECIDGPHWASIRRDAGQILDHLAFHSPTRDELLEMSTIEIRAWLAREASKPNG
jgi:hypothetical protein